MFFRFPSCVFLAGLLALAGCQKDKTPQPESTGLTGTWQLTSHQCYCIPTPLPNETVTFTATDFTFFENGLPTRHGQYSLISAVPVCNVGGPPTTTLHLDFAPSLQNHLNPTTMRSQEAQFTRSGNTLTLDYGSPCDAPLDTYQRQL